MKGLFTVLGAMAIAVLVGCAGVQLAFADLDDDVAGQFNRAPREFVDTRVPDAVIQVADESTAVAPQEVPPIPDAELTASPALTPTATTTTTTTSSGLDFTKLVDPLVKIVLAILTIIMSFPVSKWFGSKIDANEVVKDLDVARYAAIGVEKAIAYGLQMLGLDATDLKDVQVRNTFLRVAADFLLKQFPEIVRWVVTSGTVSQYIEAHLPTEAALPASSLKTTTGEPLPGDVAAKMSAT
jgi:hypothetical protein